MYTANRKAGGAKAKAAMVEESAATTRRSTALAEAKAEEVRNHQASSKNAMLRIAETYTDTILKKK